MELPKSIIVAGTGRNVGKTSFVRALIRKLTHLNLVAVKISPHFHKSDSGEVLIETKNFIISRENKNYTGKDTANFLLDGASEVFFIQVKDDFLQDAFERFSEIADINKIMVFESAGLRNIVKPGLFFVVTDNSGYNKNPGIENIADKVIVNLKNDPDFADHEINLLLERFCMQQ